MYIKRTRLRKGTQLPLRESNNMNKYKIKN